MRIIIKPAGNLDHEILIENGMYSKVIKGRKSLDQLLDEMASNMFDIDGKKITNATEINKARLNFRNFIKRD